MVCDRCIMVVKDDFEQLGFDVMQISLGSVEVKSNYISEEDKLDLEKTLQEHGFELILDKEEAHNEEIKVLLLEYVNGQWFKNLNVSDFLAHNLHSDYIAISRFFSKKNNLTIEKYLIRLKVERTKQLIQEGKLNFSEIAYELGYSNLSHLSAQFKKEVGKSLSDYKNGADFQRNPIDKIV